MQYYYRQSRPQIPPVTLNIIIINTLILLATLINEDFMIGTFGLFYPTSRFFRWWQPITHMFMHGGFWHIFFNMYALFIFGIAVERTIGSRKFLLFYFLCGLGAAALHTGVQAIRVASYMNQMAEGISTAATAYGRLKMIPTVGASGAVYGVLLSYAFLYPQNRLMLIFPPISLPAKWMVTIFLAIELLIGITGTADGVAHFAHLGGALVGWLLMRYWRKKGTLYNQGW
jgi:membrane associated rhomboid family serine protease